MLRNVGNPGPDETRAQSSPAEALIAEF